MNKKQFWIRIICLLFLVVGIIYLASLFNKNDTNQKWSNPVGEHEDKKDLFSDYYDIAKEKLKSMTLDDKIGQVLLVRYPESDQIEVMNKYHFGGYIFFEKDFKNKDYDEVKNMISSLQESSNIPLLTAVDEEGGKVVRISSNPKLRSSRFLSPSELYNEGGLKRIKEDTIEKSKLLGDLGINLNLAPVVDVSTDPNDYMYYRTLGQNTEVTSEFATTVINASKKGSVSYTLKHFPGYGSNADTHLDASIDERSYEEILDKDIPPFKAGIEAGAEAVLVSHNVVNSIDKTNPASLSKNVHELLRGKLGFTGVIITDDIFMNALSNIPDISVKAVLAGNDLIITTDYEESINSIKDAFSNGIIEEKQIDDMATKILSWKYYKNLLKQ